MSPSERATAAHDRRVRASLVAKIALPLALVALIPSLVGIKIVGDQNDKIAKQASDSAVLSKQNRRLLVQNHDLLVQVQRLAREGKVAHDSLCTYQSDLERRAQVTRDFIANPPKRILGILVTPEVIASARSDLKARESVIASLGDLNCPPKTNPSPET